MSRQAFDIHQMFASPPQHSNVRAPGADSGSTSASASAGRPTGFIFRSGWSSGPPMRPADEELAHAVELARTSDVAVVVVGTTEDGRERGLRPDVAGPARPAGRAGPRRRRRQPADRGRRQRRRAGGAAVARRGRPPCWWSGSRAWSSATRWPTSCWAPSSPAAGCPPPGRRRWPTRRCSRTTPTDGRLEYTEGLDIGHRAYLAARHRAGLLVRPRPRLHDLGVRVDRRVAPPATGSRRQRPGAQHRRAARQAGRAGLRLAAGLRRSRGRSAGWPASPSSPPTPARPSTCRSSIHARALRHWDVDRHAWAVEPGDLTLSVGPERRRPAGSAPSSHPGVAL